MAFDVKDGYVVLFGGCGTPCPANALNDTWIRAGGAWSQLTPLLSPSARFLASMTYDAKDGCIVLFGGEDSNGVILNDTWKFVGGKWSLLNIIHSPAPRQAAPMAYDAKAGHVILWGGTGPSNSSHPMPTRHVDTWAFSGGVWTKLPTKTHPSARYWTAMTFDAKDGHILLFGGANLSNGNPLNDSWEFIGGNWTRILTSGAPPAESRATLAYDPKDGYAVLFGGVSNSSLVNTTWTFAGGVWAKLSPSLSPPPQIFQAMTYDPNGPFVLMFDGSTSYHSSAHQTWKFVGGNWAKA